MASDVNGHYVGNVVANAQIMVASAVHDETLTDSHVLQTKVNTIDPEIVGWAKDPTLTFAPDFINGDSMVCLFDLVPPLTAVYFFSMVTSKSFNDCHPASRHQRLDYDQGRGHAGVQNQRQHHFIC